MKDLHETWEFVKVATIGTGGFLATLSFKDAVSIAVGLATFTYVCAKLYFLIRNKGLEPKP